MIETLVTGGTGFVGTALVRALVSHPETVRVMTRNRDRVPREKRVPGAHYIEGDIFDSAKLRPAMRGCNAIVHAVQFENAPFENRSKGLTYERVDGEGTERVVAAAKDAGIKRFIYLSGAGTREGRKEPWFAAKARAEKAVCEGGFDWTIFRPSWIYGAQDRSLNQLLTFARFSPLVPLIGSGRQKISPIFIDDVAAAVVQSLNEKGTYGEIFDLGGPKELSLCEIVRTLLRVYGKRRGFFPIPKGLARAAAYLLQFFPGKLRLLTPDAVDFITMEERVDDALWLRALGVSPTDLESGLRKSKAEKERPFYVGTQRNAANVAAQKTT